MPVEPIVAVCRLCRAEITLNLDSGEAHEAGTDPRQQLRRHLLDHPIGVAGFVHRAAWLLDMLAFESPADPLRWRRGIDAVVSWVQSEEGLNQEAKPEKQTQPQVVTVAAADALRTIRSGARLRVPFDGSQPSLVQRRCIDAKVKLLSVPVPPSVAAELLALRSPDKLRRMSRKNVNGLLGWEESGLDGDKADFYSMFQ